MGKNTEIIHVQSDSHLAKTEIGELVHLLSLSEGSVNHAREELKQRTFEEITGYFSVLEKEGPKEDREALYKFMGTEDRFGEFLTGIDDPVFAIGRF